jgi:uncharacterized membrane protein
MRGVVTIIDMPASPVRALPTATPPTATPPIATPPPATQRLGRWWFVLSCLAIAVVAPMPYLTSSIPDLAKSGSGLAEHYVGQPGWVRAALIVHAASAGLALLMIPVQLLTSRKRRLLVVHRFSGRVAVALMLVAAPSGLIVAQVSYAGLEGRLGFSALALLWGASALQTIRTARTGDLRSHRAWATRTFALGYAGVTLRLWLMVLIAAQLPADDVASQLAFDRVYKLVPFLSWVPNLLVAEWMIRRRPLRQSAD